MKTLMIAMAAAASLAGATFIGAEASAAPYGGPGGFKSGSMKPGGFKGGGAWKGPYKGPYKGHGHAHGHGHWGGPYWGYGGYGAAASVAYFASPVYVGAYEACEWVRVRTAYGWRWRPYC